MKEGQYLCPHCEVLDFEFTDCILTGSGEDWQTGED